jgi:SsrA-binding protein
MPTLAINKSAGFHYEILETLEAGLKLTGPEVKAVREGKINLHGSYITLPEEIPLLIHSYIAPYLPAKSAQVNYHADRPRALLLTKQEIARIIGKIQSEGLTIIPLKVYTRHGFIKLEIGIARGKKAYDKRAAIKKRESDRQIQRALRQKF